MPGEGIRQADPKQKDLLLLGEGIRKTDPQYQEILSRGKLWPVLFGSSSPLVSVASGVVALYAPHHTIDTEGLAATDDVDTFLGVQDGKTYMVRPHHDDRTIVLKHGTGNIYTTGGSDITLSSENDIAFFIYIRSLDKCIAWSFGAAGGAGVDHGLLGGLADDDHTQYTTPARAIAAVEAEPTLVLSGTLSMSLNEILSFRVENLGALPSAGNLGRLIYLTTDDHLYLDQG